MERLITGTGVLLETTQGTFLFQERDRNIERNPGMITPFGGGIDKDETAVECAIRELEEELELKITEKDLRDIGNFESHFAAGTYIQIYLIENINPKDVILHEGKNIIEMTIEEALNHTQVTNFTKEILTALETRRDK